MRYLHYDVFTDTMFEGNQLAVFHDARGLSPAQMQTITKEMNFSESTFILPAEAAGTDVRMRIFTPGTELPMAGHPVIGSTFALAQLGVIAEGRGELRVRPRRRADESGADVGGRSLVVCVDGSAAAGFSRAGLAAARHHPLGRTRSRRRRCDRTADRRSLVRQRVPVDPGPHARGG